MLILLGTLGLMKYIIINFIYLFLPFQYANNFFNYINALLDNTIWALLRTHTFKSSLGSQIFSSFHTSTKTPSPVILTVPHTLNPELFSIYHSQYLFYPLFLHIIFFFAC